MTTTAELTAEHLYKRVTINGADWSITGLLRRVRHGSDEVTERTMSAPYATTVPGERWVELAVGPFDFTARGDEEVTFL